MATTKALELSQFGSALILDEANNTAKLGVEIGVTELNVNDTLRIDLNGNAYFLGVTATGTVLLPTTTSIGDVSSTELQYLDGVTSAIQTQLNAKGTVASVAATVPSIFSITGSPITTSGTLAISYSGTALPIANGGTNATVTPTAGAVPYGTGTAYAFTAVGTVGKVLQSNGSSAPTWEDAPAAPSADVVLAINSYKNLILTGF